MIFDLLSQLKYNLKCLLKKMMSGDVKEQKIRPSLRAREFFFFFKEDISNYIFIVKVNENLNVSTTTIIIKYCDCDNFVELHKP